MAHWKCSTAPQDQLKLNNFNKPPLISHLLWYIVHKHLIKSTPQIEFQFQSIKVLSHCNHRSMGDDTGSFHFISLLNQTDQPHDHPFPDLELDEADMFYSSTVDSSSYSYHYDSPPSVDHNRYALTRQRFGLSTLLADKEAEPMVTAPQPVPCFAHTNRGGPHQSAPQAVPTWHSQTGYSWDSEDRRDDDEETEMVPPHVMVARSHASSAFSVLEGAGRTLKGRDLRRVRNAVWQKTGFLDLWY